MAATYTLRLGKEDFKFSAAHFTLFPDGSGELLHGHNYTVRVAVEGEALDASGLLVDIASLKKRVRAVCAGYDERTLIPTESTLLGVTVKSGQVEVRFGERLYQLPERDVVLLPLVNLTMELLARLVWDAVRKSLVGSRARVLEVEVQETAGQSCAYRAPLPAGTPTS